MKIYYPRGLHLIIEYFGCPFGILNDEALLFSLLKEATKHAGATLITGATHKFGKMGVSSYVLLKESHISIHTYPEYEYAAIDIFTCGDTTMPYGAHNFLKGQLKPENINIDEIQRGFKNVKNAHQKD